MALALGGGRVVVVVLLGIKIGVVSPVISSVVY
jgi:hypothetical protein